MAKYSPNDTTIGDQDKGPYFYDVLHPSCAPNICNIDFLKLLFGGPTLLPMWTSYKYAPKEPKSAGLYRKASGSNVSTLARAKRGSGAESLSASEEEDLKDRYYSYWERQKQVGKESIQFNDSKCSRIAMTFLQLFHMLTTRKERRSL